MPEDLSQADLDILAQLQSEARLTNSELAERTAMSTSACWRRVRALEDKGVITRYAAIVEPARMGLHFEAIVHVQLARHDSAGVDQFLQSILERPEVVECTATTGMADYHLRVVCRDVAAYNGFLEEVLFKLPCLRSAQTNMILRKIKSNGQIVPSTRS